MTAEELEAGDKMLRWMVVHANLLWMVGDDEALAKCRAAYAEWKRLTGANKIVEMGVHADP